MKNISLNTLLALFLSMMTATQILAKDFNDKEIMHIEFPGWFNQNPFYDLDEELRSATHQGKQGLMVLYTTEGCSYCGLFINKSLGDPKIKATLTNNFHSIGMEIFNDADLIGPQGQASTVKKFASDEGVMFSPTMLFYDEKGKRILRITGYQSPERFKTTLSYVTGKHYKTQTIAQYETALLSNNKDQKFSYQFRDNSLFTEPPFLMQRNVIPASGPLMVIFEDRHCHDCNTFHNKVLNDSEVNQALADFEVVRLNSQDNKSVIVTPDGSRMSPATWYKMHGFSRTPAIAIYNENGHKAIDTDNEVLKSRMMNSINYVKEKAYTKGWSYQRFARSKAIERNLKKIQKQNQY